MGSAGGPSVRESTRKPYTDSSWGSAVRPFGGYAVMYCNGPIAYSSRAMKVVADSTAEAESVFASKGAKEGVAWETHLADLDRQIDGRFRC